MKKLLLKATLVAAMAMAPLAANAAILNFTLDFTASNFQAGAPFDPVSGSLTFNFDNSADLAPSSTGLTVVGFTLPAADYAPMFAYDSGTDTIVFANNGTSSGCGASVGTNRFCSFIDKASTAPKMSFFYYSAAGVGLFQAGAVKSSIAAPGVPEPASWAMMIGGLALAGAVMRRRPAKVAYAI